MRYKEQAPIEPFRRFIKCMWILDRDYREEDGGEILWPDGCLEMIFHFGARYSTEAGTLPRSFLIGTLSRYHPLKAQGRVRLFGVRFLPWGLKAFRLQLPAELKDHFYPLSEILGEDDTARLEAALENSSVEEGMKLLQNYLLPLFQPERINPALLELMDAVYRKPAETDIPALAARSGYSLRQFERLCADLVGMTAKQLSKASRFNQARLKIFFNPTVDLNECMHELGYYDYAHFSKDFKQCLGITPARYQKWMLAQIERRRRSKGVVFIQDESGDSLL